MRIPADQHKEVRPPPPSKWRWFLVPPAFMAGLAVTHLPTFEETFSDWLIYPLAGFVPVYLAGKIAPLRQLAIALECALILIGRTVGVMIIVTSYRRAGESSGGGTGFALAYSFATVAGAASALWVIRRNRTRPVAGDLPWAVGTGLSRGCAGLCRGVHLEGVRRCGVLHGLGDHRYGV